MKWSEVENTIRMLCQRLVGGGLGVIPDALYLLNSSLDQVDQLSLFLVYHETPVSDDENERMYRRAAYFGGAELPIVRSVLYLASGLNVQLETFTHDQPPVAVVLDKTRLLWKPGLDWAASIDALAAEFQPLPFSPDGAGAGSALLLGKASD